MSADAGGKGRKQYLLVLAGNIGALALCLCRRGGRALSALFERMAGLYSGVQLDWEQVWVCCPIEPSAWQCMVRATLMRDAGLS